MKIAITGTIGSGKSEVSNYIRSKGYYVFDCDKVNASLLLKGHKAYNRIKEVFPEVFEDEILNKKKLASIIFNDLEKKKTLENICHPLIIEEMEEESKKHNPFFSEVPLLFESNMENMFDHSLLIVCDENIALSRLILRGMDEKDAINRINSQMDIKNKMLRADEIIYNNDTLEVLYSNVDKWLERNVRKESI